MLVVIYLLAFPDNFSDYNRLKWIPLIIKFEPSTDRNMMETIPQIAWTNTVEGEATFRETNDGGELRTEAIF